jgi:hypothetical protein
MQIAACSRSWLARSSGILTRTVKKHHMQMLSVSDRRVNSGSGFGDEVPIMEDPALSLSVLMAS